MTCYKVKVFEITDDPYIIRHETSQIFLRCDCPLAHYPDWAPTSWFMTPNVRTVLKQNSYEM